MKMQSGKGSQDILMYFVIYLILHGKVGIIDADTCKASKPTQTTVHSCPHTSSELQKAKEEKDCESIATLQNCSKPEEFVYHCLPSTKKDKLYEVCAPAIYSLGYCIGYDDLNQNVQILFKDSCTASSCLQRFSSADVLKYAYCQQLLRNVEKSDLTSPQSPPRGHVGTSWVCNPGHDQSTVIILICFLLFLVFTIVIGIIWRKRILESK
ncbi:uncharacterized protein LOC134276905 [Saccostrea cucullata]|uniref:uncharacterized protein LOC134276905 n=1 Tax=Saccostrea cuccullata TaxID=36930 RepID=UPI002ED5C1A9